MFLDLIHTFALSFRDENDDKCCSHRANTGKSPVAGGLVTKMIHDLTIPLLEGLSWSNVLQL